MDNSMVKRGIGAIVLAIIAALLLGWLLKDKSRERQELVDIKMPNASEMNIPSLTDAVNKVGDSATSLVEGAKNKVAEAGSSVVAAATGSVESMKSTVSEATKAVTTNNDSVNAKKPGFSIRPPQPNETKEIIDNVNSNNNNADSTAAKEKPTTSANSNNPPVNDTVVASTKKKANFTPRIVEQKKTVKVTKAVIPVKKAATKAVAVTSKAKSTTATPATSAAGKYSIQLLATSSQTRANKLANVMKSEGYHSFITQTQRDGKILYRVRVGGYEERNTAIKAQEGMKKRYQKNFFVQNSLVVSK